MKQQPLYITSDHAGYGLKKRLLRYFENELKIECKDLGPYKYVETDDYPDYIIPAAKKAVKNNGLVIVIGGSGNGEVISANKVKGMRCALAHSIETAKLAKLHNNANGLSLGARILTEEHAMIIVKTWLETNFSEEERHKRRINKITKFENENYK